LRLVSDLSFYLGPCCMSLTLYSIDTPLLPGQQFRSRSAGTFMMSRSGSTLFAFLLIRLFLTKKWTVQILIAWHWCAGWSGSTLVTHSLKGVYME
jgi:uncharacterized membrane protein YdcZ (DUF606 family)